MQLSNLSLDMNNLNNLLWFSLIFTFSIFLFENTKPNVSFCKFVIVVGAIVVETVLPEDTVAVISKDVSLDCN